MENNELMMNNNTPAMPVMAEMNMNALGIFGDANSFNIASRASKAFASSSIVPKEYQGSEANCLIAIDMATRLGISPLMVMQQLYIVNGRPAWSSQFLAAMINNSGKFKTPIQYELDGEGDDLLCYAWVLNKNGEKITGPIITMQMAKDEGWVNKNGSKWKTMPEVMIRYRAVSFFARLHCSELTMGFYTDDEIRETEYKEYIDPAEKLATEVSENANVTPLDITLDGEVISDTPSAETVPEDF